jgi:hypothetical protein
MQKPQAAANTSYVAIGDWRDKVFLTPKFDTAPTRAAAFTAASAIGGMAVSSVRGVYTYSILTPATIAAAVGGTVFRASVAVLWVDGTESAPSWASTMD